MRALRLGEIFRRRAFHQRNHLAVLRLDHVHLKVRQPVVHQERHVASRVGTHERRVVAVVVVPRRVVLPREARRGGGGPSRGEVESNVVHRRAAVEGGKVPCSALYRRNASRVNKRPRGHGTRYSNPTIPSVEGRHRMPTWQARGVRSSCSIGGVLRSKPRRNWRRAGRRSRADAACANGAIMSASAVAGLGDADNEPPSRRKTPGKNRRREMVISQRLEVRQQTRVRHHQSTESRRRGRRMPPPPSNAARWTRRRNAPMAEAPPSLPPTSTRASGSRSPPRGQDASRAADERRLRGGVRREGRLEQAWNRCHSTARRRGILRRGRRRGVRVEVAVAGSSSTARRPAEPHAAAPPAPRRTDEEFPWNRRGGRSTPGVAGSARARSLRGARGARIRAGARPRRGTRRGGGATTPHREGLRGDSGVGEFGGWRARVRRVSVRGVTLFPRADCNARRDGCGEGRRGAHRRSR